jgi:hypothetical protein
MLLDMTPKDRSKTGPCYSLGDWVRHNGEYEVKAKTE